MTHDSASAVATFSMGGYRGNSPFDIRLTPINGYDVEGHTTQVGYNRDVTYDNANGVVMVSMFFSGTCFGSLPATVDAVWLVEVLISSR